MCIAPLRWHRMRQVAAKQRAGESWDDGGYVFATRNGRPLMSKVDVKGPGP
jgi:hypothetical protein